MVQTPDPHSERDDRDLMEVGLSVKGWYASALRDLVEGLERLRDDFDRDVVRRAEADITQFKAESALPCAWVRHAIDLVRDELQRQDAILGELEED